MWIHLEMSATKVGRRRSHTRRVMSTTTTYKICKDNSVLWHLPQNILNLLLTFSRCRRFWHEPESAPLRHVVLNAWDDPSAVWHLKQRDEDQNDNDTRDFTELSYIQDYMCVCFVCLYVCLPSVHIFKCLLIYLGDALWGSLSEDYMWYILLGSLQHISRSTQVCYCEYADSSEMGSVDVCGVV